MPSIKVIELINQFYLLLLYILFNVTMVKSKIVTKKRVFAGGRFRSYVLPVMSG